MNRALQARSAPGSAEFYWDGGLVWNTPLQYVIDYVMFVVPEIESVAEGRGSEHRKPKRRGSFGAPLHRTTSLSDQSY